jgi:hypothetical protein
MNEVRHQVAIKMETINNLSFPNKCAYCLETPPAKYVTLKDKQIKGLKLKVPYCERHHKIINRLMILDKILLFFFLAGALGLAIYLHNNQAIVIGNIGFNFITAQIVFVIVYVIAGLIIRRFSQAYLGDEAVLDEEGAVRIMGVYNDAFVLQFYNQHFATEFADLNK